MQKKSAIKESIKMLRGILLIRKNETKECTVQ